MFKLTLNYCTLISIKLNKIFKFCLNFNLDKSFELIKINKF